MKIENPAALRFIIEDDLYLLNKDKPAKTETLQPLEPIPAPPAFSTPVEQTPVIDFKYMGGNKKNFLIVVHYTDNEFINGSHLTALENILKRKELSIDDVAILNRHNHDTETIEAITNHFKPQKVLLMGQISIPQNMPAIALNQIKQLGDYAALYSFSFDEMMSSNDNKKAFWDQMKAL